MSDVTPSSPAACLIVHAKKAKTVQEKPTFLHRSQIFFMRLFQNSHPFAAFDCNIVLEDIKQGPCKTVRPDGYCVRCNHLRRQKGITTSLQSTAS
eukprot:1158408-Pelagomonas_calceolata.AAC.6